MQNRDIAYVQYLRDEKGLSFDAIANRIGIERWEALQLYIKGE